MLSLKTIRRARVLTCMVLLLSLHSLLGLDTFIDTMARAHAQQVDDAAYELMASTEISAVAQSCKYRVLDVFEAVRHSVRYEPYAGAVKGAAGTWASRAGNDVDIALLLGSLMNACNVPWRLAVSDVSLNSADALAWLDVDTEAQASELLERSGISASWSNAPHGGRTLSLKNHAWIEMRSHYLPMRGVAANEVLTGTAVNVRRDAADTWVALDASVTMRERGAAPDLLKACGIDAAAVFGTIRQQTESINGGVRHLPGQLIVDLARRGGEGLKSYLMSQDTDMGRWLGEPDPLALKTRQGLPDNLPYEVLSTPTYYQSDDLGRWLKSGVRRQITVRLRDQELGVVPGTEQRLGLTRFGSDELTVRFEATGSTTTLDTYRTSDSIPLSVARAVAVRPVIAWKGAELTNSRDTAPVNFARKLVLEVDAGGGAVWSAPIVAGGHYVLSSVSTLNDETAAQRSTDMASIYGSLSQLKGGLVTDALRVRALGEYLGLVNQSILHQAGVFGRHSAAAVGHRLVAGSPRILSGIEPNISGDNVTSSVLVAHWMDAAPITVATRKQGSAGRSEARRAADLIRDLSLTACFAQMTGSDARQSASRLLVVANNAGLETRQIASGVDESELTGRVPAGVAQKDVATRLRQSALVLPSSDLYGLQTTMGLATARAGWGTWELSPRGAAGAAVSPDGAWRGAWAPVPLYPLYTVTGGYPERYEEILTKALDWAGTVTSSTVNLDKGVVAAAAVATSWLKGADDTALPDPAAVLAAAILLHGSVDYFSRPHVEELRVEPALLNTTLVGDNPARTLRATLGMSSRVDFVNMTIQDRKGATVLGLRDGVTSNSERVYVYDDVLSSAGALLTDGEYTMVANGEVIPATVSEAQTATFTVDNKAPDVYLEPTTATISGKYRLRGRCWDEHLKQVWLRWRQEGSSDWKDLPSSGTISMPLTGPLTTINTRAADINGTVVLQLAAEDAVGNRSSTEATFHVLNDTVAPAVSLTANGAEVKDGATLRDVVSLGLTATDLLPEPGRNLGLKSVRMTLESENDPAKKPQVLVDQQTFADKFSSTSTVSLDTMQVQRSWRNERWRLVVEATDLAGNATRHEVHDLHLGNLLMRFDASPLAFRTGYSRDWGCYRQTQAVADFTDSVPWTLAVEDSAGHQVILLGSGTGDTLRRSWYGERTGGGQAGPYVAPDLYQLVLRYTDGGSQKVARLPVAVTAEDNPHTPWIQRIESLISRDDHTTYGARLDLKMPKEISQADMGTSFVATGEFPLMHVVAQLPDTLKPFLDGRILPENDYPKAPSADAYWALEYKASGTFPTYDDWLLNENEGYDNLTVRDNWRVLTHGATWPANGQVEGYLDTGGLSQGYYDVRLWLTDGTWMAQQYVFHLKVSRATSSPETGGAGNDLGAMTLSATDMSVPFNGFPAAVTRSYNSNDTLRPGPLGYGWQLGGITMDVQTYEQGAGEYDEAMIRLPDGRQFFFANNPVDDATYTGNGWATQGEYKQRPYGMRLFRPGASRMFHYPDPITQTLWDDNQLPTLAPGAADEHLHIRYPRAGGTYEPGEVAYLQTEDKTWYIFEWKSGEMLEIIKPDSQRVTFAVSANQVRISDTSERTVLAQRDPANDRITTITDPIGRSVSYEYDKYGNLSIVTDRSGRKRFYIYDTPDTQKLYPERKDLTGENTHFLVDVRVDEVMPTAATLDPAADPAAYLAKQKWPGNRSIMQVSPDGNKMKRIETYAGSVNVEHNPAANGKGGTEVVHNGQTDDFATVTYDEQHRVTQQKDFWGGPTDYVYGDSGGISGVQTRETNALGQSTDYGYTAPPNPEYSSFADMFEHYVKFKEGSDEDQPGYLTGAQAQPTTITQYLNGQPITTEIGYEMHADSKAAFQPLTFKAPGGQQGNFDYDSSGKMIKVTVGVGSSTSARTENTYFQATDGVRLAGRLKSTTTYPGAGTIGSRTTNYSYTFQGNTEIQTVRDAQTGLSSTSIMDAAGNLISSTDQRGRSSSTDTDGEGRPIKQTDADGNKTVSYYNVMGLKTAEMWSKAPCTSESLVSTWTFYEYDEAGRARHTWQTKADGKTLLSDSQTLYASDSNGRTETSIGTDGSGSRSIYDGGGRLLQSEQLDKSGTVVSWTHNNYDALGRTVFTRNSRDVTNETSYDDLGRTEWTQVTAPGASPVRTEYGYDDAGRQRWVKSVGGDGQPHFTVTAYDAQGRVSRTYTDAKGKDDESGPYTEVTYDGQGRRDSERDEAGRITRYAGYDEQGHATLVTLAFGTPEAMEFAFSYDEFGELRSVTNPRGAVREKRYDDRGRLVLELGPVCDQTTFSAMVNRRAATQYEYYSEGKLRKKSEGLSDASGNDVQALRWTEFTYDPYSGAMLEKQVHNGSRVTKTTWAHSELVAGRPDTGQLDRVEVRDESGALKHWRGYTYDSKDGRLKQVTSPEGTINYTYAPTGELTGISSSAGQSVAYSHDAMGRLMSVSVTPVGGGTPQITFYEYDPVTGARKHIARGNGTSTDFTYDGPGRLTKIEHKSTTGSLELGLAYSRDLSGIITGTTETQAGAPTSSWTYGYDGLKRLTSAVCTGGQSVSYAYTYDKAANRLTETQDGITKRFSYNSLDQLITEYSAGDVRELTYDVFGNLVSEKKNGTLEREYTWDGENRLTRVRLCADGDIPEQNIYYGYDSEGTRVSKSLKQGSAAAAKNTNYLTDYQNPTGYSQTIGELDPADTSADRAYAFDDTGLLMQETRPDGSTGGGGGPPAYQTGYTLSDHLGTSRVLTDAQGSAQTHYTYAPFGEVKQGNTAAIHHAFTGQYREGETALQYHRARWLNPTRASWLSQDPVWDWPGNFGNAYGYGLSNVNGGIDIAGSTFAEVMTTASIVQTLVSVSLHCTLSALRDARQYGYNVGQWIKVLNWASGAVDTIGTILAVIDIFRLGMMLTTRLCSFVAWSREVKFFSGILNGNFWKSASKGVFFEKLVYYAWGWTKNFSRFKVPGMSSARIPDFVRGMTGGNIATAENIVEVFDYARRISGRKLAQVKDLVQLASKTRGKTLTLLRTASGEIPDEILEFAGNLGVRLVQNSFVETYARDLLHTFFFFNVIGDGADGHIWDDDV